MDWKVRNFHIVVLALVMLLPFSISDVFAQELPEQEEEINNPPVIGQIDFHIVDELTELAFTIPATDDDGDDLLFSMTGPDGATIDSDGQFSWTPTEEQGPAWGAGMYVFEVTVTDGVDSVSKTFYVQVNEVNTPPYFTSSPVLDAAEDEPYSYEIAVADADVPPEKLLIGATSLPLWLHLESNVLSGVPTADDVGDYQVILGVSDNSVMVEQSFTITVVAVNDAPVIGPVENQIVDELTELSFTIPVTDEDDDDLMFSMTGPDGATIDSDGQFSWTPTEEQGPGLYHFVVTISDGIESDTVEFDVQVNEVNSPPYFTSSPVLDAAEDNPYSYEITVDDSDLPPEELQINAESLPSWLSLESNVLSGVPLMDDIGDNDVVLSVTDGVFTVEQAFTITVAPTNDAPVIISSPTLTTIQEDQYSYILVVEDEDGDQISFNVVTKPSWLELLDNGDSTATISGIPTLADLGVHQVTIEATDGQETVSQSFTIEVLGATALIDIAIQDLIDNPEYVPDNLGSEVSKMANLLNLLANSDKETHAAFIAKFHEYKAALKVRLDIGQGKLNSLENRKLIQELDGAENSLKVKSSKLLDMKQNTNKIKTAIDYTQTKKALIKLQNHAGVIKNLLLESEEKNKILEELHKERMKLLKDVIIQEAKHNGKQITPDEIKKIDEKVKQKTTEKKGPDRVSDPHDNSKKGGGKDKEKSNNGKGNGKGNSNSGKGNSNGKGNSK